MTPKQLIQVNKIRSILTMIWSKKGMAEFHYDFLQEVVSKHSGSVAIGTACVRHGLMSKPRRGYYIFCRKPNKQDAVKIYDLQLKMVRSNAIRAKEKSAEFKTQQAELAAEKIAPIRTIDETYCIDFLKARGYKIMRPIQPQYEEL